MKKRLILLGLGLAVVGTGMIVKKIRKRNNEEVNEVEETIETEEVAIDEENIEVNEEDIEVLDCEDNYIPDNEDKKMNKITGIIYLLLINRLEKIKNKTRKHTMTADEYYLCGNIEYKVKHFYHKLCLNMLKNESIILSAIALVLCRKTIENMYK